MASDTALQVNSGQIQNLHTIDYGFTLSKSLIPDNNGWPKCVVSRNNFFSLMSASSHNPCVYFYKLIEAITLDESIFSLIKAKQWGCVISEFDLWLSARLYLMPYLLDLNEIFRICGYNIRVNLVFSKLHGQVNQFTIKDLSKVSENIWLSL